MVELIGSLGVEIEWTDQNSIRVQASEVESVELDDTLADPDVVAARGAAARARTPRGRPPPGGDVIGPAADRHPHPCARGARGGDHDREAVRDADGGLRGRSILLDEASVTATENP